nr:MAG TPA: Protein of unknown function (DUF3277) [Caudoviricetes sp.]
MAYQQRTFVYSFEDTVVTISHPALGVYSAYGTGIGTLSVAMSENVTTHEVAADQSVIVSKHVKRNGVVTFDISQVSDFNAWLKKFTSYIEEADASEFALATISISNKTTGDNYYCTGVSHQKIADNNFQSQAQNRSWAMMCAHITNK